ncbi:MAG: hypothetical protein WCI29_00890 [Actinomycetes bacterium]
MALLILRFTLAPLTIFIATMVQRRWGHESGGRVVGLPLTTGPFLVLVALIDGPASTSTAAHGVVAGQVAVILFCATYAHLARRIRPLLAVPGSLAVALVGVALLSQVRYPLVVLAVVLGVAALAITTWPAAFGDAGDEPEPLPWELPVRLAAAGLIVGTLTVITSVVTPFVAGTLATMPVILSVLAPTTHIRSGIDAASSLLRGTVRSVPGNLMFASVVSWLIQPLGWIAFVLGLGALVVMDRSLTMISRRRANSPTR